jgi:hypothetical protein
MGIGEISFTFDEGRERREAGIGVDRRFVDIVDSMNWIRRGICFMSYSLLNDPRLPGLLLMVDHGG